MWTELMLPEGPDHHLPSYLVAIVLSHGIQVFAHSRLTVGSCRKVRLTTQQTWPLEGEGVRNGGKGFGLTLQGWNQGSIAYQCVTKQVPWSF